MTIADGFSFGFGFGLGLIVLALVLAAIAGLGWTAFFMIPPRSKPPATKRDMRDGDHPRPAASPVWRAPDDPGPPRPPRGTRPRLVA